MTAHFSHLARLRIRRALLVGLTLPSTVACVAPTPVKRAPMLVSVAEFEARTSGGGRRTATSSPLVTGDDHAASDDDTGVLQSFAPPAAGDAGPEVEIAPHPIRDAEVERPASGDILQGRWIRVASPQPVIPLVLYEDPIADVVSGISEETGFSIVLSNDSIVRHTLLTAEVRSLPWHQALEVVLQAHGLRAVQLSPQVIQVVTEARAERDREPEPIELRFLNARDIAPALERIVGVSPDSAGSGVVVYGDAEISRRLVVYASAEKLVQVRNLVRKLDHRPATVTIETRLVQVNRTAMRKIGISYTFGQLREDSTGAIVPGIDVRGVGTPGGISSLQGPALRLAREIGGLGVVRLNVFVDAVTGRGLAETQTAPVITTTSDVPARIRVGDAFILPNLQPILTGGAFYPPSGGRGDGLPASGRPQDDRAGGGYPAGYGDGRGGLQPGGVLPGYGTSVGGFTRFETGTTLVATPYVLGDGLVRMKVELSRDGGNLAPDGRSITGGNQEAFTDVIVRSGVPIVIGGLTVHARSRAATGIPFLESLPLVGRFFRTEENASQYQDLIILLVPRIHEDDRAHIAPGSR